MNTTYQTLDDYCTNLTSEPPAYLANLERETNLKTLSPQMLCGKLQGRFLSMISNLYRPKTILEIGTFTGYSTLCLAEGLADEGVLHTFEVNDELFYLSNKYFQFSPYSSQIYQHKGKAEELLPPLELEPDLVYIDAGKKQYEEHYKLVINRLKKGGIILVDNVLWSGKINGPLDDSDSKAIHEFNCRRREDTRIEQLVLPIRDGISMLIKKK
jgi:caffeoyl-CoA O-methyltransferase